MKTYLLIILMTAAGDGGRFVSQPIEFKLLRECEAAMEQIRVATSQWGWKPALVCAEKSWP